MIDYDKELKYLEKIENDVNEKMYDLLIVHIFDRRHKISSMNSAQYVKLLDKAISKLQKNISLFNRLSFYRYLLICCNEILYYDKSRKDITDLKTKIIDEYTASEHDSMESIPLNYQINEVRITFDTDYLCYLIPHLMNIGEWHKALYCWHAVNLIEPDNEKLGEYHEKIKSHLKDVEIKEHEFAEPKNKILALDANVVISRIFDEKIKYSVKVDSNFDLEKLGNNNSFIITPSIADEVKNHLDFQLKMISSACKKRKDLDYKEIETRLIKKFDKILGKYAMKEEVDISEDILKQIEDFYSKYMNKLEEITLEKLGSNFVSHKLRKLSQREGFLPEEGDRKLLAEVIKLNKTSDKEVGILTEDKDFVEFASAIKDAFEVNVYK